MKNYIIILLFIFLVLLAIFFILGWAWIILGKISPDTQYKLSVYFTPESTIKNMENFDKEFNSKVFEEYYTLWHKMHK